MIGSDRPHVDDEAIANVLALHAGHRLVDLVGAAPQFSGKGATINTLLPGPFDTGRLRNSKEITKHLTGNAVAGRVGDPDEMGAMCAFLCSRHAGYLTGQNILMDGGLYPGSF